MLIFFAIVSFSILLLSDQHQHVPPLPLLPGRVEPALRDRVHHQAEVDRPSFGPRRWKQVKEDKKFISWISSQVPNPERSPPSRRHLEARHLLHQARYFQGKSVESPIKDGFHANSFVNIGINTIL